MRNLRTSAFRTSFSVGIDKCSDENCVTQYVIDGGIKKKIVDVDKIRKVL